MLQALTQLILTFVAAFYQLPIVFGIIVLGLPALVLFIVQFQRKQGFLYGLTGPFLAVAVF